MGSSRHRIETDVMKMLMSDYEVELVNDNMYIPPRPLEYLADKFRQEFHVKFPGPPDTPFSGGRWKIHVELPDQYPYKSPSIGFVNRIFHPNIDELSGSVCLDVINQTWSPMYNMMNIFDSFLPHLLRYPNASDPLNGEAAALMLRDSAAYETKVKEYVARYASKDPVDDTVETRDEDTLSSVGSLGEEEEEEDEVEGAEE
ncbi:hypothetical protein K470DRAFT_272237 [Piedraia hortae CBS 480.64]|uniref:UBC core domain-containing protein n=1 Tax=Piedraia hortae CBS 480.64 TaxID=1314780 RepID=A0A6A7BTI9_9PEZI|nr:hypothetical protein K470DRAFT_272237 [Piedraia hortae CBS 480.64]